MALGASFTDKSRVQSSSSLKVYSAVIELIAAPTKKKGNQLSWKQCMVRDATHSLTKSVGSFLPFPTLKKGARGIL